MLNTYQRFLLNPKNKNVIIKIVKHFLPDVKDSWLSNSGKSTIYLKDKVEVIPVHSWIIIRLSNKSDIGIDFPTYFSGRGYELKHFQKALKDSKFRVWRFALDPNYSLNNSEYELHDFLTKELNVPLPTAEELMKYYYRDE